MTLGDPDETDQLLSRNCAYAMTFHQSGARDHFCGFLNHMAPRKKATGLTPQHKAALAQGRADGLAVRRYLEALEAHKPKRGRKRSPESIDKRLKKIEELLVDAVMLIVAIGQGAQRVLAQLGGLDECGEHRVGVFTVELFEREECCDAGVEIAAAHGGAAQRGRHRPPTAAAAWAAIRMTAAEDFLLHFEAQDRAGRGEGGEKLVVG